MKVNYKLDNKVKYVCLMNYYIKYSTGNLMNLLSDESEDILILEQYDIYEVTKRTMFYTNKQGIDYSIVWYDISIDTDDRFISLKEEEAKKIMMPLCDFRQNRINDIIE